MKSTLWWIPSSKFLAHRWLCCFPMLEQPHGMAEESPIMFLPWSSHLNSCRCIFPGSEKWDQSQPCQCCPLALSRPEALLLHCQWGAKAEASRPPKSAFHSATSQPTLAVAVTVPGELVHSQLCKHSCLALSSCCFWMCSVQAQPWPLSSMSHLPLLHLWSCLPLLSFSFSSWPPLPITRTWWGRGACPAISLPWEQGWLSCQAAPSRASMVALLALPCTRAWHQCQLPLATLLVPSFSVGFGPQRDNLGKDKVAGASRLFQLPWYIRGMQAFCGPLTEGCSLPSAYFTREVYLRTEKLKPWWNDMPGFRLFWAENRRVLGPPGWQYNLWASRSHSSGSICKPWL